MNTKALKVLFSPLFFNFFTLAFLDEKDIRVDKNSTFLDYLLRGWAIFVLNKDIGVGGPENGNFPYFM